METKVCSKCNITKNLNEFHSDKYKKDNLSSSCKICNNNRTELYKLKNPDKVKESKKKEYLKNIERYREHNKKYRDQNGDKITKYLKDYYLNNKEILIDRNKERYQQKKQEILHKQKEYYLKNLKNSSLYQKKYRQINKEKLKKYKNQYTKIRKETDILFYLRCILSHRVREFLKTKKINKKNKTFDIVGCSPIFLKEHLEKQFVNGMSWDNKGMWHIDHIIPLSSAKTEEEIYKLCHYTNLQPLWAEDNLKKSNKIVEPFNGKK
jgi:hypothetical protein